MNFKRCQPVPAPDTKKDDIVFQAISWHVCDHEYSDGNEADDGDEIPACADLSKFLVKVFGVTEDGRTVSANLLDFPPYFFIKITHRVDQLFVMKLKEHVLKALPLSLRHTLKNIKIVKKKDFWGFQGGAVWNFARFTFSSLKGMRAGVRIFEREVQISGVHKQPVRYKLYESTIEPALRLMHTRDVMPTGWMRIPAGYYSINDDILQTTSQIDVSCNWACLQPVHLEKIAPIMVMSFDLECTSSHGDFPVPKKDYRKVANDIYQFYRDNMDTVDTVKLANEIGGIFDDANTTGALPKVFTKRPPNMGDIAKRVKQHIDEIVAILLGRREFDKETRRFTPVKIDPEAKRPKEMKRDDVITVLTEKLNMILPALEGDPIIQIGVTVHCYGDRDCTYRHIITLGTCAPIEGATVEQCETEAELIMKFRDLVVRLDPDVVTGFNIFGFDMSYLNDRVDEVGIATNVMKLGRIREQTCEFVEKNLSSSALGDNLLRFIDMEGRVLIDVMKVVQRDHKLDSYKLDNVANHFMKMNKHDVHPNDIFRLYKGSAEDRRVVANYCIQDCALCNQLIMKLEILANNIGMSNVCNVPLSYIFMRGQGIKIFSLVAKQCREADYLIPTLRKPRPLPGQVEEEDPEDESGYEGAIVLEPKTGIYLDRPISVLDYASLYPSSMISENISHDSIVLDPRYDNLPGVEYLDISYDIYEGVGDKKVKTGVKTCRFMQPPNGEKSMIPKILMKLLKARKDTRKKIEYETLVLDDCREVTGLVSEVKPDGESESELKLKVARVDGTSDIVTAASVVERRDTYDDFQKAVLDGLQLSYKVSANSLYGQCGARTSSIFLKEVAASTTATGRKMICLARDYILKNYEGSEIVYGDSVTGDTPLLIRFPDGTIDIITIETLTSTDSWIPYDNFKPYDLDRECKQQSFIDAEVWTGKWAKINRVIRHHVNKQIYRVNTFRGCVDVTEDHSLISKSGNKIKPTECIVDETECLHKFPEEFVEKEIPLPGIKNQKFYSDLDVGDLRCQLCGETKHCSEFYINSKKTNYCTGACRLCIKIKNAVLQGKPIDNITSVNKKVLNYDIPDRVITKEEAWVWGIFFGDGSCGYYKFQNGYSKHSWAINNSNKDYLNRAREYLMMVEPSEVVYDFKINDTIESSAVYKLIPNGSQVYMVNKYRALFYDKDKYKKVPKQILNAPLEVRKWFLEGYLTADGAKKGDEIDGLNFACKGKIGAQGLYYIARSIGWDNLRINIHPYKENTYWIRHCKDSKYFDEGKDKVKKIFKLNDKWRFDVADGGVEDDDDDETGNNIGSQEAINSNSSKNKRFVYDIETTQGRFNGGVGEMILVNTDSIFVSFKPDFQVNDDSCININKKKVEHAWNSGVHASTNFRKTIKPPHDLEMEKVMYPFILFSKKRYCAYKYEGPDAKPKLNTMGVCLKRRDNPNIVKKVYGGILDIILNEHDIKKSIGFLKNSLQELIDGKVDMEDLTITKSLKSEMAYKDPDKIAHVVLAKRIGERSPGEKPQANDRVPYVYIQTPPAKKGEKVLQGERIELPSYVKKNNLKLDYEYYITNQIMTPVCQIYALALDQIDGYRKTPEHWAAMEQKLLRDKEGDLKKVREKLADLKENEAKALLFDPILIQLANKKAGYQPITNFFRVLDKYTYT